MMAPWPPGAVQLWWARRDALTLDREVADLPADERATVDRLFFEADRRTARLARVMVRWVLAAVAGRAPAEWQFARNRYGRPTVTNLPADAAGLTFNLSHTRQLVVCAVGRHAELGVDVEDLTRRAPLHLARRYFSAEEAAELSRHPAERQHRRFFEYWTLKEAYIKARGLGLSLPLDSFCFGITPRGINIRFVKPEVGDLPERWRFFQGEAPGATDHLLALALAPADGAPLALSMQSFEALLASR
jgi:4'-phosphopantetheinyl transferase